MVEIRTPSCDGLPHVPYAASFFVASILYFCVVISTGFAERFGSGVLRIGSG